MKPHIAKGITLPFINPLSSDSVTLTLPYPVSLNRIWRSGKGRVYRSSEYKAWVTEAHIAWLQQRLQLSVKSIQGQYSITILAHPPDKRHRDLGNLEKVVSDFLQTIAVIENDSLAGEIIQRWDTATVPTNCIQVTVSHYP